MKKKCTLIAIAMILVMLLPAYAEADKSLDEIFKSSTVFTKKGINRFYVNGYYRSKDAYSGQKILTLGTQDYVPAALIPESFPGSSTTAQWYIGGSDNPSQSLLLFSFSNPSQKDIFDTSGPVENNKILLNANSKKATINGKEVMLSHAVIYMNGKFFIPVNIMESLFGLKLTLIEDLYFWGEDVPSIKTAADQSLIKDIQTSLKTPEIEINDERLILGSVHVNGQTYFINVYDYNLWVKEASGKEKRVSLPEDARFNLMDAREGRLYYISVKKNEFYIYEYNLVTQKTKPICNATKTMGINPETFDKSIKSMKYEDKGLYVVVYETEPSKLETLYSVQGGKAQKLFSAEEIETYIVTGDKVIYTFNTAPEDQSNLRVYSVQTKKSQSLGQAGTRYFDTQVKNGKLYVALPVLSKTSPPDRTGYYIVCLVDMNTGKQVKLTSPTEAYWIEDQIYYVDGVTRKLMKSDREGKNEKILVDQPIDKIRMQGQDFYYTLEGHLAGVFRYSLKTGAVSMVMPMVVDELILLEGGVWGLSYGYAPGFYKAENGQAVCKFSGRVSRFLSNGTEIMFNTFPSETLKFIK